MIRAIFLSDLANRNTSIECCFVYIKPHARTSVIIPHILQLLDEHNIRVVGQVRIPGSDIAARKIVERQYSALYRFAEMIGASDIVLLPDESLLFRKSFATPWKEAVESGRVFNANEACRYLYINFVTLAELWHRSKVQVKLRQGIYCAELTSDCSDDPQLRAQLVHPIFVLNGFFGQLRAQYEDPSDSTDCLLCEWDEAKLSWQAFSTEVIGDEDPLQALSTSIRGSVHQNFSSLGLSSPCSRNENVVHTSRSAFEGLIDRMNWLKNAMLYTDLFGARLLSARLKSTKIKKWLENPIMSNGKSLLEEVRGMNSSDCIDFFLALEKSDEAT